MWKTKIFFVGSLLFLFSASLGAQEKVEIELPDSLLPDVMALKPFQLKKEFQPDQTAYVLNGLDYLAQTQDYGLIVVGMAANEWINEKRGDSDFHPEKVNEVLGTLNEVYQKYQNQKRLALSKDSYQSPYFPKKEALLILDLLGETPLAGKVFNVQKKMLLIFDEVDRQKNGALAQQTAQLSLSSSLPVLQEKAAETFAELWKHAQVNPDTATLVDGLFSRMGASIQASEEQIIRQNPRLQQLKIFFDLYKMGKAGNQATHDALSRMIEELENNRKKLNLKWKEHRKANDLLMQEIRSLKEMQKELERDRLEKARLQRRIVEKERERREKLKNFDRETSDIRAALILAEGISVFVDDSTRDVIRFYVSMTQSTLNFSRMFLNFDEMSSIELAAAGVQFSAQLYSLLMNFGKAPFEARVLRAIQELRKEVQELRREMHHRFDRVDQMLIEVLNQMNRMLFQSRRNYLQIRKDLGGIHEEILRTRIHLDQRIEDRFSQLKDDELSKAIHDCLTWRRELRSGNPLSEKEFESCAKTFARFSYELSSSDFFVHSFDEQEGLIYNFDRPVGRTFNVFRDFLTQLGVDFGLNRENQLNKRETLPNPVIWAKSARNYVDLYDTYPEYGKKLLNQEIFSRILRVGRSLEEFLVQLSGNSEEIQKQKDKIVVQVHPNSKALDAVFELYLDRLKRFHAELARMESQFKEKHGLQSLEGDPKRFHLPLFWSRSSKKYKGLFRGEVPYVGEDIISACSNTQPARHPGVNIKLGAIPSENIQAVFHPVLAQAVRLGLGKLEVCYSQADFVDYQERCAATKDSILNNKWCARVSIQIDIRYNDRQIYYNRWKTRNHIYVPQAHPTFRKNKKRYLDAIWDRIPDVWEKGGAAKGAFLKDGKPVALANQPEKKFKEIRKTVEKRLDEIRHQFLSELSLDLDGGKGSPEFQKAYQELLGAELVLKRLLSLIFPVSLWKNPEIRQASQSQIVWTKDLRGKIKEALRLTGKDREIDQAGTSRPYSLDPRILKTGVSEVQNLFKTKLYNRQSVEIYPAIRWTLDYLVHFQRKYYGMEDAWKINYVPARVLPIRKEKKP